MASGLITEYLGQGLAASRPATPDIPAGAIGLFYATDSNEMSAYADGAWLEDVFSTGGALLAANNLSDLASVATALSNLGIGTAGLLDVDTDDTLAADSDSLVPSQQAVKAYVDANAGSGGYEGGPVTAPTTTSLGTWVNQGTSTATDGTDRLVLKPQVDGKIHGREMVAPSAPFNLYMRVDLDCLTTDLSNPLAVAAGFILRDNSDGELIEIGVQHERTSVSTDENNTYAALIGRWPSASGTVNAYPVVKYAMRPWMWLRVNVTSTTITFYVSQDGKNWLQVGTETISTYVDTIDRVGVYARGNANSGEAMAAISYFSTTAPV